MRRYYFHCFGNGSLQIDEEGILMPSIDDVEIEATKGLAELARECFLERSGVNRLSRSGRNGECSSSHRHCL
ncbi:MAG: hypothetical protein BGN87_23235 [Rhizobiales bacterium 65-79]|nr:MAG: hypothetical protein BGN87_23235 [Rhizobiales bacterium 65-79]